MINQLPLEKSAVVSNSEGTDPKIVHAVDTKHDPVIDEHRPYLQEIANDKFNTKAHQMDIRELIAVVQKDNNDEMDFRQPLVGDLYFEDELDDEIEPSARTQASHSSAALSSSSQHKMSSSLTPISEDSLDDNDESNY